MNRLAVLLSKETAKLLHKVFACAVVFCIVAGSAESVTFTNMNISFSASVKISADTLLSQFFSVSTLPVNAISKMFIETVAAETNVQKNSPQKNKDGKEKEGSSARASAGYSILPGLSNFVNSDLKTKSANSLRSIIQVSNRTLYGYGHLERDRIRTAHIFMINIIFLLLSILLARRSIGGDDNIINIKNKKNIIARLV